MKLPWRRVPPLPQEVLDQLALGPGDRVLAWGVDTATQAWVVASVYALHQVPAGVGDGSSPSAVAAAGSLRWRRPWWHVAAGAWEPRTRTITVTWADGSRPSMWSFEGERVVLAAVVQDRVTASVVVSVPAAAGERELGRVSLRKDLERGTLIDQVVPRRGVDVTDPEVRAAFDAIVADLREQAGI
ncbi:hypothetical protein [Austwickia sp. TVS 96-490-7B]|uniref:hypothetical protein n=1 Tax=Austwickia sp. TVS 96-490-7B TaxID=2830843 RepID=UPI001C56065A|nr:hypothetical protein [Austwickia sp. TVS 96-490-7B]